MLKLYKNIDIPPKSPFGKGGLGRFAPGAKIKRVSLLRSTANAVKIAKLKANKSLHANYSMHCFIVKSMQMQYIVI